MNEKRFTFRPTPIKTHHLWEILDNDKRLCIARYSDVGNVVDLLNEMNDTFVTLTRENYGLITKLNEQQATISALKEENEQLKRQNKALKDSSLADAYFDYLENSRTVTLKVAEEQIRVTKYEELFDDE